MFFPGDVISFYSGWKVKKDDPRVSADGWDYSLTTPDGIIIGKRTTENPYNMGCLLNDAHGTSMRNMHLLDFSICGLRRWGVSVVKSGIKYG